MPNWCTNKLIVTGDEKLVAEFIERAEGPTQVYGDEEAETSVLSFHQLVPIPDDILALNYSSHGYHTEIELWGCKWGASSAEREDIHGSWVQYVFDTPWSPPIPLLLLVSAQFPTLTFDLRYEDENVELYGRVEVVNGKNVRNVDWDEAEEIARRHEIIRKRRKQCVRLPLAREGEVPNPISSEHLNDEGKRLEQSFGQAAQCVEKLTKDGWICFLDYMDLAEVVCAHPNVSSESAKLERLKSIEFDTSLAL